MNDLHWLPRRSGYLPGEAVERAVFGLDGELLGRFAFTIQHSPGSGFAGQVYRAAARQAPAQTAAARGGETLPALVALKVLRPRSRWKLWLRDTLFRVCYQTSFSPRLRVEDVRAGLGWQAILRAAAGAALGSSSAIARPYGYYWDEELAAFGEVHEWVDGRAARSEPDDQLIARWLRRTTPAADNEVARKKTFMDALANLCREIGASGLARQYEWWTLVSQSNVLTRTPAAWPVAGETAAPGAATHSPAADGTIYAAPDVWLHEKRGPGSAGGLVAVDCRPGLAVPFFLPLSPAHARVIWDGLRRGVLVHYNESNHKKLAAYLADHPSLYTLIPAAERLARDETAARAARPDLWQTHSRIIRDPAFRLHLRRAAAADWLRLGQVDEPTAAALPGKPVAFFLLALLGLLPLIGSFAARLLGNSAYRAHLADLLRSPAYRRAALSAAKTSSLPAWQAEERVHPAHAALLQRSTPAFLAESVLLAWLPPGLHRALVDPALLRQRLTRFWRESLQLLLSQEHRLDWIAGILRFQAGKGMLAPERLRVHLAQLHEPRMQTYIRDLGFAAGLDIFSRLAYLGLGVYGLSSGDFLPLGLALLGPIPPSGPLRVLYLLAWLPADLRSARRAGQSLPRVLEARLAALLIAPWRFIGNLFPLVEISAFYTRISFLLAEYYISRAAAVIPVFGGEGRLLQHGIFQLCYNLPLSLRREIREGWGAGHFHDLHAIPHS